MTMKAAIRFAAAAVVVGLCACSHGPSGVSLPADHRQPVTARAPQTHEAQGLVRLGVRAYRHRSYAAAHRDFSDALRYEPNNSDALYDRAITRERLHAYGGAESDLRTLVRSKPQWMPARLHLASAEYFSHHYAQAARDFDIVLRGDDKAWKIWLDDGVAYYRLHRYVDARRRFARALVLRPRSGLAHFWLGMSYQRLGVKDKARTELALAAHSRDGHIRMNARRALSV